MYNWNFLSLVGFLLILVLSGIQANVIQTSYPDQSQNELHPVSIEEGRGLLDRGIFRRISKFFGWGGSRRKSFNASPVFRRPEMLPLELQYPKNRRSGYEPSSKDEERNQFNTKVPKKWLHKSQNSNSPQDYNIKSHKLIQSSSQQQPLYKDSVLPETYTPYKNDQTLLDNKNMKIDRSGMKKHEGKRLRQFLFSDDDFQNLDVNPAKVESKKPVVTVYKNGETRQFPQMEKDNIKKQVHSKFALTNYATNIKPLNPYLRNTQTKKKASPVKPVSHSKQNFLHQKKTSATQKNIPHPYPFVTPNSSGKETKHNTDYDEFLVSAQLHVPEQSLGRPQRVNNLRPHRQKGKGLLDNMTSFASNIFGNIFSRSSKPSVKRPYRSPPSKILPPGVAMPRSSIKSSSSNTISKKIKSNFFAPSPQQGIIAEDAFQPIFRPSHSMDSKLPQDIMKPLIIPQKRKAQAAPELSEPELIDFFR